MMGFDLSFEPFISWPAFYAIATAAAAIAALIVYLRRRGWSIRIASLALMLLALANPLLSSEERQQLPDIAAIVVDDSASQNIGKRREQTETSLAELRKQLDGLGNTEVRITRTVTGNTPDTDGTRVFQALEKAIESIPPDRFAGAIILSDGQVHDVMGKGATESKAPVHSLISGSKSEVDRRVVIDEAPRFAIIGQPQKLTFRVEDAPETTGDAAVSIRYPDGTEQQLLVPPNQPQTIDIPLQRAGQNVVEITAAPMSENEVTLSNNRSLVLIKGIRDRLRVLLVSGEPHPGERTWRNLLKSDPAVDLVHFTILRPAEKQDGTLTRELSLIAFPTRELFIDKISNFDLVIFDRYRRQSILPEAYLQNVTDYVNNGGAILISSGPDLAALDGLYSTPLAAAMPAAPTGLITEQAFRPGVTVQGWRHPVSQNLPGSNMGGEPSWGRWFRLIDSETTPDAHILLDGPDQKPLLVVQRVGQGRVAQFLSDHGWLWARGYDGGGPQMEILRRLAHWLMKEPDLEEEALNLKQEGNNIRIERRTMADKTAPVILTHPDEKQDTVTLSEAAPGLFTASVPLREAGLHSASDGTLTTVTAIGNADTKEMADVRATSAKLQLAATQTRAGTYWMEDGLPRLTKAKAGSIMSGAGWLALRDNQQYRVTAVREIPLFATLASLAILLLAVTGMWYREGR